MLLDNEEAISRFWKKLTTPKAISRNTFLMCGNVCAETKYFNFIVAISQQTLNNSAPPFIHRILLLLPVITL